MLSKFSMGPRLREDDDVKAERKDELREAAEDSKR
jgi:hypothetical protein